MEAVLLLATLIAPVVLALVELVKRSEVVSNKWLPFVSLALGLAVGYAALPFTELDTVLRLWAGALAGLSATGLFELVMKR